MLKMAQNSPAKRFAYLAGLIVSNGYHKPLELKLGL